MVFLNAWRGEEPHTEIFQLCYVIKVGTTRSDNLELLDDLAQGSVLVKVS